MRINNLYGLAMLMGAVMIMPSCSADPDVVASAEAANGLIPVEIHLGLSVDCAINTPAGSRSIQENTAPRMLVDWQGQQCINDLRLYIFESDQPDGDYIYFGGGDQPDGSYLHPDFKNDYPYTGNESDGSGYSQNYESHDFAFTPRLRIGHYYKILAIGRDDIKGADIPTAVISYIPWGTRTLSDPELEVGVTELHDVTIRNMLSFTKYPYLCTEIFSGLMLRKDANGDVVEDYLYVTDKQPGFEKKIQLERAVAGLYVHLTDIPTTAIDNSGNPAFDGVEFNPDEVTIYMTCMTNRMCLSTKTEIEHDTYSNIQVGYADLSNHYGETSETSPWYQNDGDKIWHRDAIDEHHGVRVEKDCLLMTNFLMPFDPEGNLGENESTFTLQLRQRESDYTLTKKVKCKIVSMLDPATGASQTVDFDPLRFPIIPNMLYALGSPGEPFRVTAALK